MACENAICPFILNGKCALKDVLANTNFPRGDIRHAKSLAKACDPNIKAEIIEKYGLPITWTPKKIQKINSQISKT